ncbi:hypothetical protein DV515_00016628 [Chloebia gouldiae]|uniref:Uncharacterized protein n=1 Tax=Chloebia gouldiae TaxID=44316 RepID=A0A3L8RSE5_CHLGU|nr:hypothetical protein DV515_00016628 [Chloebia gouldiae]
MGLIIGKGGFPGAASPGGDFPWCWVLPGSLFTLLCFVLQIFRRADKNGECSVPAAAPLPAWLWLKQSGSFPLRGLAARGSFSASPGLQSLPRGWGMGSPNSPPMPHAGHSPFQALLLPRGCQASAWSLTGLGFTGAPGWVVLFLGAPGAPGIWELGSAAQFLVQQHHNGAFRKGLKFHLQFQQQLPVFLLGWWAMLSGRFHAQPSHAAPGCSVALTGDVGRRVFKAPSSEPCDTGWAESQTLPLLTQELLVTYVRAAFHPNGAIQRALWARLGFSSQIFGYFLPRWGLCTQLVAVGESVLALGGTGVSSNIGVLLGDKGLQLPPCLGGRWILPVLLALEAEDGSSLGVGMAERKACCPWQPCKVAPLGFWCELVLAAREWPQQPWGLPAVLCAALPVPWGCRGWGTWERLHRGEKGADLLLDNSQRDADGSSLSHPTGNGSELSWWLLVPAETSPSPSCLDNVCTRCPHPLCGGFYPSLRGEPGLCCGCCSARALAALQQLCRLQAAARNKGENFRRSRTFLQCTLVPQTPVSVSGRAAQRWDQQKRGAVALQVYLAQSPAQISCCGFKIAELNPSLTLPLCAASELQSPCPGSATPQVMFPCFEPLPPVKGGQGDVAMVSHPLGNSTAALLVLLESLANSRYCHFLHVLWALRAALPPWLGPPEQILQHHADPSQNLGLFLNIPPSLSTPAAPLAPREGPAQALQGCQGGFDKGGGLAPASRILEPDPCFHGLQGRNNHSGGLQPHSTWALREGRGGGAAGGALATGRTWAELRDEQGGSPGWILGGRGWVEEAAPGLRNGAATQLASQGCGASPSLPHSVLQEMLVEQIFLLLQPHGCCRSGIFLPWRASPPQGVCGGACVCLTWAGLGGIEGPCGWIPAQRLWVREVAQPHPRVAQPSCSASCASAGAGILHKGGVFLWSSRAGGDGPGLLWECSGGESCSSGNAGGRGCCGVPKSDWIQVGMLGSSPGRSISPWDAGIFSAMQGHSVAMDSRDLLEGGLAVGEMKKKLPREQQRTGGAEMEVLRKLTMLFCRAADYFSAYLGEYRNVLSALETLNTAVLAAMDKTKLVRMAPGSPLLLNVEFGGWRQQTPQMKGCLCMLGTQPGGGEGQQPGTNGWVPAAPRSVLPTDAFSEPEQRVAHPAAWLKTCPAGLMPGLCSQHRVVAVEKGQERRCNSCSPSLVQPLFSQPGAAFIPEPVLTLSPQPVLMEAVWRLLIRASSEPRLTVGKGSAGRAQGPAAPSAPEMCQRVQLQGNALPVKQVRGIIPVNAPLTSWSDREGKGDQPHTHHSGVFQCSQHCSQPGGTCADQVL